MQEIKTLKDVEAAIAKMRPNTAIPNLRAPENMPALMDFLGNPQERYKVIHVAGTSGKTSVAHYAAALLQAAGKTVGMTISPHVDAVSERVQINLQPLPEVEFCAEFAVFLDAIQPSGIVPTYFEAFTAFAFWEFARKGVEYAVVEVGIGGLADSTNVIRRPDKICIINDIGYGHVGLLGRTLGEIARNKAGIIQLHNAAFFRQQPEEIAAPVRDRARRMHADLHTVTAVSHFDFLPLFQRRNFAMSQAAVRYALERDGVPPLAAQASMAAAHTAIPGRMEVRTLNGKTVVQSAAHNTQKLHGLVESVQAEFPAQPIAVLFALNKAGPKFFVNMAAELRVLNAYVVVTGFPQDVTGQHGSADPEEVVAPLRAEGVACEVVVDPAAAFRVLQSRNEPVILVTGSFLLLNYVRPLLARASHRKV